MVRQYLKITLSGKRRDCALWNELFSIKRAIPEVRGAPCTNSKSHSMKKLVYAVCRSEPLRIFRSDDSCPSMVIFIVDFL
jgi:hypothetical protein